MRREGGGGKGEEREGVKSSAANMQKARMWVAGREEAVGHPRARV
jgi:hypothetical protein